MATKKPNPFSKGKKPEKGKPAAKGGNPFAKKKK